MKSINHVRKPSVVTGTIIKKWLLAEIDKQVEIAQKIKDIKKLPLIIDKEFLNAAFIWQNDVIDMRDLESNSKKLDIAFVDWLTLSGSQCKIKETINWRMFEKLKENKVTVIPRFSNSDSIWRGVEFFNIIKNKSTSECLINEMKYEVLNRSLRWINIDIDNVDSTNSENYTNWLIELTRSFHENNLYVTVSVPINSVSYDYHNIGLLADLVIIKAFDEHSSWGKPWPIAWKIWFEDNINLLLSKIPNKKMIVAIWIHSYDWNLTTDSDPEIRSFDRTIELANNIGVDIKFDEKSWNSNFTYKSADW
jgi:peptidoglycan-N-acetylglucosamine deacetylase